MRTLIDEAKSRKDVILFIDEMHMIMGAGDPTGNMDIGNILKPAMARGDIQVIGATTLKEYRQIEKDSALERRLQPIIVEEPSNEETIEILEKLKNRFEVYHGVTYNREAIVTCVELADKYIHDRFMPDKAIDLMDIAGSKMNLKLTNDPMAKNRRMLNKLTKEKTSAITEDRFEDALEIRKRERDLENKTSVYQKEQESNQKDSAPQDTMPVVPESLIAQIIEERTGIQASKLTENEQEKVSLLHERLSEKVIGQDQAIQAVSKSIRRSRVGLSPKGKPVGSFLFVGPSGVGKTGVCKKVG